MAVSVVIITGPLSHQQQAACPLLRGLLRKLISAPFAVLPMSSSSSGGGGDENEKRNSREVGARVFGLCQLRSADPGHFWQLASALGLPLSRDGVILLPGAAGGGDHYSLELPLAPTPPKSGPAGVGAALSNVLRRDSSSSMVEFASPDDVVVVFKHRTVPQLLSTLANNGCRIVAACPAVAESSSTDCWRRGVRVAAGASRDIFCWTLEYRRISSPPSPAVRYPWHVCSFESPSSRDQNAADVYRAGYRGGNQHEGSHVMVCDYTNTASRNI